MRMLKNTTSKLKVAYWSFIGAISALMISVMPTWAAKQPETIWDRFSTIMRDFYGQILAISTIVAVTMDVSMLARKIQQLMIFFSLLIPDMTNEEEQLLDEALLKTYSDFGISHDNESLYEEADAVHPKMKPSVT